MIGIAMFKRIAIVTILVVAAIGSNVIAAENADKTDRGDTTDANETTKKELQLKDLIPDKSPFGPAASDMAFSHDGRYAAYLYRPYKERRHGSDLYLFDVETAEARRITMASVMAAFQKNTRDVVEDRKKKARTGAGKSDPNTPSRDPDNTKADANDTAGKSPDSNDTGGDKQDRKDADDEQRKLKERGDWVTDKDADDEKAPRYAGIDSLTWSPVDEELLFLSEGDVYRYKVADGSISRLTHTRDRETSIEWLPDGKGFVFRRSRALMRVLFGNDVERQLDPAFPNGGELSHYSLSPDGARIAFLTRKEVKSGPASKVEIADYEGRLMKAKEVERHVSDDPLPEHELRVYIYQLSDTADEQDRLTGVFLGNSRMPSDEIKAPIWSPDSRRMAFLVYEQDPELIRIYETRLDPAPQAPPSPDNEGKDNATKDADTASDKRPEPSKAREIYRFLHTGGPNTPRLMQMYYLADNHRIVYLSEQSGFRHLHLLDPLYESTRPLTQGPFEVYPIDITKDHKWIFVRATKETPSQIDVYRVHPETGEMTRLTQAAGVHTEPAVSPDGTKVLTNLAAYATLRELVYIDGDKQTTKVLTDSHPDAAREFAKHSPEFFDYTNRHGHRIYGMGFKPDNWQPADKRPCVIYFYGGPLGTQKQVTQAAYGESVYAFPWYMAQKHGYAAVTIDPRGNSGYAGVFEKANFEQVGRPQVEDLVDGVKFLTANWGVDPNRVAIHGWSFGGFQTQMCMYTEPNVFAAGIAGAGPTEWENYNSWYTRHAIGRSEPGEATLKKFSLLPLARNLKGHLLLVHGVSDSNVLYQDTVKVYRELLKAGKETLVELFLDPTGGHGLGGDVNKLARYRKYEQFLLRTIGRYEPSATVEIKPAEQDKPDDRPTQEDQPRRRGRRANRRTNLQAQ